jgi:hypothetical protein
MQAARRIMEAHLPLGVVTKQTLLEMARSVRVASDVKLLILSNVNMLDDEEAEAIRAWVRAGGCLYASGATSLVDKHGRRRADFALADVFGVSAQECDWKGYDHYIAPTEAGRAYFPEFDATYPAFTSGYNVRVMAHDGATVLATTTLPWPAPDPSRFASIHSNPPWVPTDRPEIVQHTFGQGRVIYSAGVLETLDTLTGTFLALLRALRPEYTFEVDAPAPVEATLFHQPDRGRYVLSLVNFQKDLPNIPVDGMTVRLRLPERADQITHLPEGRKIHFRDEGGVVTFTAPRLDTLVMCAIGVGG